jgi:hypothetical protein
MVLAEVKRFSILTSKSPGARVKKLDGLPGLCRLKFIMQIAIHAAPPFAGCGAGTNFK